MVAIDLADVVNKVSWCRFEVNYKLIDHIIDIPKNESVVFVSLFGTFDNWLLKHRTKLDTYLEYEVLDCRLDKWMEENSISWLYTHNTEILMRFPRFARIHVWQ